MTTHIDQLAMIEGVQNFLGPIDLGIIRQLTIDCRDQTVTLEVFVRQSDGSPLVDSGGEAVTAWVTYPYRAPDDVQPALNTEDE